MPDISESTASNHDGPGQPGHSRWGRLTGVVGVLALLVAVLALARDVIDFRLGPTDGRPGPPRPSDQAVQSPGGPTTLPSPSTAAPGGGQPAVRLDTLVVDGGEHNRARMPALLAGQPGYERAVVIGCPSNAARDTQREVTFQLQRRYAVFTATVRPYFASPDHRDSKVYTYAQVTIRNINGTTSRPIRGAQYDARMETPRELTADVTGADQLVLRVECEWPEGVVILTDARLTRAD